VLSLAAVCSFDWYAIIMLTRGSRSAYCLSMSDKASRLRQRLVALESRRALQLEFTLAERGPCLRGSFGTRGRVCGNPNCRCAAGELHFSKYLSVSVDGRTRQIHVAGKDEAEVAANVERYQRWRRACTEIANLSSQQLSLLDALGAALLKSYPEGSPVPLPGRRGPKPKGGRAPRR